MSCPNLSVFPAVERVQLRTLLEMADLRVEIESKRLAYLQVIEKYATARGPQTTDDGQLVLDDEGRFIIVERKDKPENIIRTVLEWMIGYDLVLSERILVALDILKTTESREIGFEAASCIIAKYYFDTLYEKLPAA